jgi:hypothetical protein
LESETSPPVDSPNHACDLTLGNRVDQQQGMVKLIFHPEQAGGQVRWLSGSEQNPLRQQS